MWARPADLLRRERRLRGPLPELGGFRLQGLHIARPFALAGWELLAGSDGPIVMVHELRRVDVRDGRLRQPECGRGDDGGAARTVAASAIRPGIDERRGEESVDMRSASKARGTREGWRLPPGSGGSTSIDAQSEIYLDDKHERIMSRS